jgi:uncharacterized protein (TIGR03086 family)
VQPGQWTRPTPCSEWNARQLVNHNVRGNLNYAMLLRGGSGREFVRLRDAGALGDDPVAAYHGSVRTCLMTFRLPSALDRVADYPLGAATGRRLVAIRLTDTVIHTWDLARAVGLDERLAPGLTGWILDRLGWIYDGIAESPLAEASRFFAPPLAASPAGPAPGASPQDRLLRLMGRSPSPAGPAIAARQPGHPCAPAGPRGTERGGPARALRDAD